MACEQTGTDRLWYCDTVSISVTKQPYFRVRIQAAKAKPKRLSCARRAKANPTCSDKTQNMQAGVCFGLSAASCKTGILLVHRVGWTAFPVGLTASVLLSSLGFMLQTLGLKDGNTVIVCTCAAVSSMATGTHHCADPSERVLCTLLKCRWKRTRAACGGPLNGREPRKYRGRRFRDQRRQKPRSADGQQVVRDGAAVGVLVGLLAMGEPLPSGFGMKLLRLVSWVVTIAGVSALANGKGEDVIGGKQQSTR